MDTNASWEQIYDTLLQLIGQLERRIDDLELQLQSMRSEP
jgi:hypothetical protein